ncbi:OLC1v1038153C1 [Oldenlandia corymbosa var. corymbosa]|uniref:OLC1v1038153C1 n=1 Tax=Oldenlandia corymbosa var. corymbosa TaxID=529605 RepID=A0AAV1D2X6_OLDCO|nr:OLC1v1038153C1 [Oldenlandia corymbosa var. corymbosa]
MAPISFSHMKYSDSLKVVAISIFSATLCEFLLWLLIYRTISYKSLSSTITKASKKLEIMKNLKTSDHSKKSKIRKIEMAIIGSSRGLYLFKLKSGAIVISVLVMNYGVMNSLFEGKPVAKLPFVPFQIVQRMSRTGLSGDDMTDCSMFFLYFLCSFWIRTNLQKLLGFSPPREAAITRLPHFPYLKPN